MVNTRGANGRARRLAQGPLNQLEELGEQLSLYGRAIGWIPRTLRRYRSEIARLLAEVYLELKGGKERRLDLSSSRTTTAQVVTATSGGYGERPRPLAPRSTEAERAAHLAFLRETLKDRSLWAAYGLEVEAA